MSINALTQATGADLLNILAQEQGAAPATAVSASVNILKKALAEAQLSAAEVLDGGTGDTGSLVNLFA